MNLIAILTCACVCVEGGSGIDQVLHAPAPACGCSCGGLHACIHACMRLHACMDAWMRHARLQMMTCLRGARACACGGACACACACACERPHLVQRLKHDLVLNRDHQRSEHVVLGLCVSYECKVRACVHVGARLAAAACGGPACARPGLKRLHAAGTHLHAVHLHALPLPRMLAALQPLHACKIRSSGKVRSAGCRLALVSTDTSSCCTRMVRNPAISSLQV